jgi:uncharacterized protein YyaL (SSP411 family)
MDGEAYADPTIARLVSEHYIPVRVDPDRRPDIGLRYQLGAWPTTALLTPGGYIISGGTFVPRDRFEPLLIHAAAEIRSRWDDLQGIPPTDLADIPREPVDTVGVHHALEEFRRTGSAKHEAMAARTLDAIAAGELRDANQEKVLGRLAALLRAYLDGFATFGFERFRDTAGEIVGLVQEQLADGHDAGWGASRRADGHIDRTLFTDWNAAMTSAALAAAQVTGETSLRDFALKSVERVLLASYRPGQGVAHTTDAADVRGLLHDHLACAEAMLDAHEVTGHEPYEMMAEELAHYTIRVLGDGEGGFRDRSHDGDDVGLLRAPLKPVADNCYAARVLARLARTSGQHEFADCARRTLAAVQHRALGPLAPHYALAVRAVADR